MTSPTISIIGAYPLQVTTEMFEQAFNMKYGPLNFSPKKAREARAHLKEELSSVVLFELSVKDVDSKFQVVDFGQETTQQAAYCEVYLNEDGTAVISKWEQPHQKDLRIAFYLHFVNVVKPLQTSYGPLRIPSLDPIPLRLSQLNPYTPVD